MVSIIVELKKVNRIIVLIFLVVVVVACAWAEYVPYHITAPGITGMRTNIDPQDMEKTDASLLVNVTHNKKLGTLERRVGLVSIPDTTTTAWAKYYMAPYYDQTGAFSQLVFITNALAATIITTTAGDGTAETQSHSGYLRAINWSPKSGHSIANGGGGDSIRHYIPYTLEDVGFLQQDDGLIITAKGMVPTFYTPYSDSAAYRDTFTVKHIMDSIYYGPRAFSLGLEAPGQLRAVCLDASYSPLYGYYRWTYGWMSDASADSVETMDAAIPTRWVWVDSQAVYLSLFEGNRVEEDTDSTGDDAYNYTVMRQRYGDREWQAIDAIEFNWDDNATFFDEGQATQAAATVPYRVFLPSMSDDWEFSDQRTTFDIFKSIASATSDYYPGQINQVATNQYDTSTVWLDTVSTEDGAQLIHFAEDGGNYMITYSYYDPQTGLESPFGPVVYSTNLMIGIATDTIAPLMFYKPYTRKNERPSHIRLYRSNELGASADPTEWFLMAELDANNTYRQPEQPAGTVPRTLYPGLIGDAELENGAYYMDSTLVQSYIYRNDDIVFSQEGTSVSRPPYVEQLQYELTDMTYSNGRYWGLGDPRFKARLFYSNYNDAFNWGVLDYIDLGNHVDPLISVKGVPNGSQELIYALKRNSCYALQGYDAEYDLSYSLVSTEAGAVNDRVVIELDDGIIFLSPNNRIYQLGRDGLKDISLPIVDQVKDFFGPFDSSSIRSAYAYRYYDKVCFTDSSKADSALSYNIYTKIWSWDIYKGAFEPMTSFRYDTLSHLGYDESDYWMLELGSTTRLLKVNDGKTADDNLLAAYDPDFVYQTPFIGEPGWLSAIERIQFAASGTGILTLLVIGSTGDTLSTRTLNLSAFKDQYDIGIDAHAARYMKVEFSIKTGFSGLTGNVGSKLAFSDVTLFRRKVARVNVQ